MADRRTTITIDVQGLAQLQQANTALNAHNKIIQQLTSSYQAFNGATGQLGSSLTNITNNFNTFNNTTNTTVNNVNNMGRSMSGLLGTMLQYRAVGLVFEGVTKAITGTIDAMREMEKQAARVQRVSPGGSTPSIRADIAEEAARTGADVKDIGEAYYQLKTQIKDNATAFSALRTSLNLVIGTESDARDTTRAMLQVYNQFGDQLGKNVDQSEKMRRAGELLAVMWKGSAAEISEITAALKYLGPIAEAAHVPLEQVAATISALTFEGVRGRMGGTEAGQLISQIIKNFNPATGMISNKGATLQAGLTPSGGLDLIQTMKNFNEVASHMPVATAQKFSQAISGTQNAWRLFGTVNPEFLRVIQEKLDDATKSTHGLTTETDKLRQTMTTTAQEFQRAWGGAMTAISNAIDASGLRNFLRDIADGIQRINNESRNIATNNGTMGGILSGRGAFPGDPRAVNSQARMQRATLQEMLEAARGAGVHGNVTTTEMFGGAAHFGNDGGVYDLYRNKTVQERGYLQRFMQFAPTQGALAGPGVRDVTFDLAAMQAEYDRLNGQLQSPSFGRNSGLQPANPNSSTLHVKGGYTPPPDKAAQKAADEAEKARQEALDETAKRLQTQFEFVKKLYGPDFPETKQAAAAADAAAAAAGDEDTRRRLRLGLSGNLADTNAESKQQTEEQLKDAQEKYRNLRDSMEKSARTDYDLALQKYGLFSGPNGGATGAASAAAQRAEEAAAIASGDTDKLRRLRGGLEGTGAEFASKRQGVLERQIPSFGDMSIPWDKILDAVARNLGEATDQSIRSRQRGLPSTDLYGDQSAAQSDALKADAADIQATIDKLSGMNQFLPEVVAGLAHFRDALEDNAAQQRRLAEETLQRGIVTTFAEVNDKYARKINDIESSLLPERQKLVKQAEFAQQKYTDITQLSLVSTFLNGAPQSQKTKQDIENADIARKQANLALEQFDRAKVQGVLGPIQNRAQQTVLGFLHGQGNVGDLFKGLGDEIVNAVLQPFVKSLTDPLVIATTKEILSLEKVSVSLDTLNSTLSGSGPGTFTGNLTSTGGVAEALGAGAAAAAAGAVGGLEAGADGTQAPGAKKRGNTGQSDLQKGLGAGLAAYSIASTSAQQGVNLGNLLGAAATGFAIGGPIGAAVGGVVDLIGGLFHKSNKPTATPQDLNPAYYNAPAAFDVAAYNYSAYGKLPTVQNIGFDVKPQNVPIVNVFVDGAKVAAQQVINSQGSSLNVNLGNTTRDRYIPI